MGSRFIRHFATKIKEGDILLIRPANASAMSRYLTKPMKANQTQNVKSGCFIRHNDLIGSYSHSKTYYGEKKNGESNKKEKYMVAFPTTEEYVNLIRRRAQPIYSLDAQAIVSVADIHMDYPEVERDEATGKLRLKTAPLQFLEAGTGHGSLTLAICKAIHAANAYTKIDNDMSLRGAVLHSIDCRQDHSDTGKSNIDNFKRGLYSNDVEFYVSKSPSHWLDSDESSSQWKSLYREEVAEGFESESAFLDGVFLDMADSNQQIVTIAKYLKLNAPIILFCPSLTQIMEILRVIDENPETRMRHVRTLQLLDGAGGGLKEWDTRKSFIRSSGAVGWVCRPKVGARVVAGGFIIELRKQAVNLDTFEEIKQIEEEEEDGNAGVYDEAEESQVVEEEKY